MLRAATGEGMASGGGARGQEGQLAQAGGAGSRGAGLPLPLFDRDVLSDT